MCTALMFVKQHRWEEVHGNVCVCVCVLLLSGGKGSEGHGEVWRGDVLTGKDKYISSL